MRAVAVVALVLCLALATVAVKAEEPLTSLMELDSAMPSELASPSDAKILALHEAAGSFADEAIADAQRDSLLMETESATSVGAGRHWDDSVPEIHLRSTQPEETLSTALETVDHLDHVRPGLTAELPSAVLSAFQQKISPAILGEDHVFIQHAAQTTQAAAADSSSEVQAVVVSDANSEADSVTEAEAAQGVMTMSELEQMMELEGMSQQEIDQYMQNLGEMTVDVEAETASTTESEANVEAEVEAEAAAAADSEAVQAVVVDMSAETDAEGEAVQTVQVDAESEAESETETEAETETETETEAAADAETETETEAEADADSESESEGEYKLSAEELSEIQAEAEAEVAQESPEQTLALLEADSESEAEAETEGSFDMELDAEAESDSEAEAETETESQDEVVHLAEHAVPAQLQESAPSTVTPLHSAAYTRAHPTLKRLASAPVASGYSLPQPVAMMETASKAREVDLEKYNPNAIQLGPSKDAYGYVPMTGAEFLNSNPRPVSLAQMSVQLQHQEGTWLPPPIEAEATPNYIVGVGGLRPNPNAGPYQGQYGLAAGGQSVHQEPSFIQY